MSPLCGPDPKGRLLPERSAGRREVYEGPAGREEIESLWLGPGGGGGGGGETGDGAGASSSRSSSWLLVRVTGENEADDPPWHPPLDPGDSGRRNQGYQPVCPPSQPRLPPCPQSCLTHRSPGGTSGRRRRCPASGGPAGRTVSEEIPS